MPAQPDCVFCQRIADHEYQASGLPGVGRFPPLGPVVPGHMLFVPYRHVSNAAEDPLVTSRVFEAAADWAQCQREPHNLITSTGAAATQTVRHLHVHYVPRATGDGLPLPWTGQQRDVG